MATDAESFNRDLYDLLKVRGYHPVPLDSKNQRVNAPQEADVIQFVFTKDGKEYGKVWISVDKAKQITIYYDNDQEDSPNDVTPGVEYDDTWTGLLKNLKKWAMRRQLDFDLQNKDRLGDDMRQREHYKMKEKLGEGYHSMGKKASYNDGVPNVKIVLQHSRNIEEGEQRFRNVARIFVENTDGERFLLPTTRPGIARVYARHIAEGGTPYDERGKHITSLVEEYNQMAGFVRATRNGQFNESTQSLVNEGTNHYNTLRETLGKMTGLRGYNNYFESWTPALMEDDGDSSAINELFVQETLDPRIESVMPILSRIHKKVNEMQEVDALAEWADGVANEHLVEAPDRKYTVVTASNREGVEVTADNDADALEKGAKQLGVSKKEVYFKSAKAKSGGKSSTDTSLEKAKLTAKNKKSSAKTFLKRLLKLPEGEENLEETHDKRHGGPYDRGSADSYYRRDPRPHYYVGATASSDRVERENMTPEEIKAYHAGYKDNDEAGEFKQWNEDNEKIDEISASKLGRYARAAADDSDATLDRIVDKGFDNIDPKDQKRHEKRHAGGTLAIKKVAGFPGTVNRPATLDENLPDTIKKVKKGIKSFKRGMDGWGYGGKGDSTVSSVKDVTNNLSPDSAKFALDSKVDKGSPAELQQKLIRRKMKQSGQNQVEEDLDANQKRAGQLGPTEKVKHNNIGKLVGANESVDAELAHIRKLSGL